MKYKIIYADPPWQYANQKNNDPAMGGIVYKTMTIDEIKKLPVNEISDKDSVLCMWVTMPKLIEGLEVIKAWGFEYRTCLFNWVKVNPNAEIIETEIKGKKMPDVSIKGGFYSGMGHWVNGNSELCLFAKKGKPKRMSKEVKQLQVHPRQRHSQKPILHSEIVKLFGDLPRIELFARQNVDGWDCLGNELNGMDIGDSIKNIINNNQNES